MTTSRKPHGDAPAPRAPSPPAAAAASAVHAVSGAPGVGGAVGRVRRVDASVIPLAAGKAGTEGSRTDQIVQAITQAIIEHRLRPGEKLVEQRLGDRFAVSRTVVRQALNRLAEMKLVQLEPARGAFVAQPSVQEAHEVFAVRRMIEGQMLREVVARATAADLKRLRAHLREERTAVKRADVGERTRLLFDFHVRLAEVLGNTVLVQWMQELVSRCSLITLMLQSDDDARTSNAEHADILDAIEARDADRAVELLEQHLSAVITQITPQTSPCPTPTPTPAT